MTQMKNRISSSHDRSTNQTKVVSLTNNGSLPNDDSSIGMITPDGQFAVFTSSSSYLASGIDDSNGANDVFLRDLTNETTELISKSFFDASRSGNAASEGYYISDDWPIYCLSIQGKRFDSPNR